MESFPSDIQPFYAAQAIGHEDSTSSDIYISESDQLDDVAVDYSMQSTSVKSPMTVSKNNESIAQFPYSKLSMFPLSNNRHIPRPKYLQRKSFVWKFFRHPPNEEILKARGEIVEDPRRTQCTLCDVTLAFNASGTTTTMLNHLKSRHPESIDIDWTSESSKKPRMFCENGDEIVECDSKDDLFWTTLSNDAISKMTSSDMNNHTADETSRPTAQSNDIFSGSVNSTSVDRSTASETTQSKKASKRKGVPFQYKKECVEAPQPKYHNVCSDNTNEDVLRTTASFLATTAQDYRAAGHDNFKELVDHFAPESVQLNNHKLLDFLKSEYDKQSQLVRADMQTSPSLSLCLEEWYSEKDRELYATITAYYTSTGGNAAQRRTLCTYEMDESVSRLDVIGNVLLEWNIHRSTVFVVTNAVDNVIVRNSGESRQAVDCTSPTTTDIVMLPCLFGWIVGCLRVVFALPCFVDWLELQCTARLDKALTTPTSCVHVVDELKNICSVYDERHNHSDTIDIFQQSLPFMNCLIELLDAVEALSAQTILSPAWILPIIVNWRDRISALRNDDNKELKHVAEEATAYIDSSLESLQSKDDLLMMTFLDPMFKEIAVSATFMCLNLDVTAMLNRKHLLGSQSCSNNVTTQQSSEMSHYVNVAVGRNLSFATDNTDEVDRYMSEPGLSDVTCGKTWWSKKELKYRQLHAVYSGFLSVQAFSIPHSRLFLAERNRSFHAMRREMPRDELNLWLFLHGAEL